MREIQFALYERKILCFGFRRYGCAGKGGNIKRIREKLDPTGYEVNGISALRMSNLSIIICGDLLKDAKIRSYRNI